MIHFSLKCAEDHAFDSWFQSSEAFDKLHAAGMVACSVCGSTDVSKSLMAPKVATSRSGSGPLTSGQSAHARALAEMRRHVEDNSEYVGLQFAAEARKMHLGDAPERAIYGEAKPDEAKQLVEDGIPIAPLPFMPPRKRN